MAVARWTATMVHGSGVAVLYAWCGRDVKGDAGLRSFYFWPPTTHVTPRPMMYSSWPLLKLS